MSEPGKSINVFHGCFKYFRNFKDLIRQNQEYSYLEIVNKFVCAVYKDIEINL